ncbi:MAG: radical SAM family heme chaperone HemW [Planctomycetes bacterium]|nr:radical SAM family heme chaperone HemW [Planctomycetota bacterium]
MNEEAPGLYVHVPFCQSRCGYCTFASEVYSPEIADRYLTALLQEISAKAISTPSTVFIGGGTPSVLTPGQMERLLTALPRPAGGGEFTCEVNPETASREKLAILQSHGVNRLSFGVQTFSPEGLRLLGRAHDSRTVIAAVELALAMDFPSVSLDLIHGWPGQDTTSLLRDLRQAVSLSVTHLSTYSLILDESAPRCEYFRGLLGGEEIDSERVAEFFQTSHHFLADHGYTHYETSNYARPGYICRHNWNIWRGGEYWGVGLSAHSHINGRRFGATTDMETYLHNAATPDRVEVFSERLDPERKARETAVFWLRLYDGIELQRFTEQTGFDFFTLYSSEAPDLGAKGWLEISPDGSHVRVPPQYQPVLDTILVDLV